MPSRSNMNDQMELQMGRYARDAAIAQLSSSISRQVWIGHAYNVAYSHALKYGTVTSDDVRKLCPIPIRFDARILGAVFNPRRSGFRLKSVGFTHTKRREGHARIIRIWRVME